MNLHYINYAIGDADQAIQLLEKAKKDPYNAQFRKNIYEAKFRLKQADEQIQKMIDLDNFYFETGL